MKSIILVHTGFQDQEVQYPFYRLREEGDVLTVGPFVGPIKGILGTSVEADTPFHALTDKPMGYWVEDFDLLVLPGGVKAMEKMRLDDDAVAFVHGWAILEKPIASICSGAQMLISAHALRVNRLQPKRRIAAYPAMAVDVENAGAIFVNEPVVVDGNIVSSPHYKHLAEWMKAAIDLVKSQTGA